MDSEGFREIPGKKMIDEMIEEMTGSVQTKEMAIVDKKDYHRYNSGNFGDGDNFFGMEVLMAEEINGQQDHASQQVRDMGRDVLDQGITESKDKLGLMIRMVKNGDRKLVFYGVKYFFSSIFSSQKLRTRYIREYEKIAERDDGKSRSDADLAHCFPDIAPQISDNLYLQMLTEYRKQFKKHCRSVKKRVYQECEVDLLSKLLKFGDNYGIDNQDLTIGMKQLKKRLKIYFDDSQIMSGGNTTGHTNSDGVVHLNPFLNFEKYISPTFSHEILHNLGGTSYRVREVKPEVLEEIVDIDPDDSIWYMMPEKVGLTFYSRFKWLDEGVTSMIENELHPEQKERSYEQNIVLIDNILRKGKRVLGKEVLYKAYFEGRESSQTDGSQLPWTKKMFIDISDSYAPGFLARLDLLIGKKSNASQERLELINSHFEEIKAILEENRPIAEVIKRAEEILVV